MPGGTETGLSAMDIIKAVGGFIGTFIVSYLLYAIRSIFGRIKTVEDKISDQQVTNQSFSDYQLYKDEKDRELKEILTKINDKIGDLKEDFETKIQILTSAINDLKVEMAKGK